MKKAPLLATLALAAACDDGEQIKELLSRYKVETVAEKLQDRCRAVIEEGQVMYQSLERFEATFEAEFCRCEDQECYSGVNATAREWGMPGNMFVSSGTTSASVHDEKISVAVTIDDNVDGKNGKRCWVNEQLPGENDLSSLESKRGDAFEACKVFIGRVRDTVAAIIKMAQ